MSIARSAARTAATAAAMDLSGHSLQKHHSRCDCAGTHKMCRYTEP